MGNRKIIAIGRAPRFSPRNEANDAAIMAAVCAQLRHCGHDNISLLNEEQLATLPLPDADAYISMGRHKRTIGLLADKERHGCVVVNHAEAVSLCTHRCRLMTTLEEAGISVPPAEGHNGYWVKRGDGCTETASHVGYAGDAATAQAMADEMTKSGIMAVDIRAHIEGDVVKFYGVHGTTFFRCYATGGGRSQKQPHHYPFDAKLLAETADKIAQMTTTDVYGGDCIVQPDGRTVIIDWNDWPSFSRCRQEAATAIAQRIAQLIEKKEPTT